MTLVISLNVASCSSNGSFRLSLFFEDDAARQSVTRVNLWVAARGIFGCPRWLDRSLKLEDLNIYSQLMTDLAAEEPQRLSRVPPGSMLFLAEGEDADGAMLLRGCTEAVVEAGAINNVALTLKWACHVQPGGEVVGNGRDDDCDGVTDECWSDSECNDGEACTLDLCTKGVCHPAPFPDGLACQDGDRCTRRDACANGSCAGEPKDCRAYAGQCLAAGCDPGTGNCAATPVGDGTACDDGLYCTVRDACAGSACVGEARGCEEGDLCTRDLCDEYQNRCEHVLEARPEREGPPGDSSCSNGLDDDCDGQIDLGDPNCLPCEEDRDCQDGNSCTADACVAGSCRNLSAADGTVCDDGRFCTVGDSCKAGVCGGPARDCSYLTSSCGVGICVEGRGRCAIEPRADGTACDDGLYCTVADSCRRGACAGIANDCDDNDFCTADGCDGVLGRCAHELRALPGAEGPIGAPSCFNQVDDDCDGLTDFTDGNCAECAADTDCGDGNACTTDRCTGGRCENAAVLDGTVCDDGRYCTDGDACAGGVCRGAARDCDGSGTQCRTGVCNEELGRCEGLAVSDGKTCDDGNTCTAGDACRDGVCVAGPPRDCNDGNVCTDDSCEPLIGCVRSNNTNACDDGNACTVADACVPGGCEGGTPLDCDDANVCTDDGCDPAIGCRYSGNTVPCDDGQFCNGADICDVLGSCATHLGNPCGQNPCDETARICGAGAFVRIVTGQFHTCGLTASGRAFCWGENNAGQLGNGTSLRESALPLPVDTSTLTGSKTFVHLALGDAHTCGVASDGTAYCWGRDTNGQLGDGGTSIESPFPVAVDTIPITGSKSFVQLAPGEGHTCGLTSEGRVFCWGRDLRGELGDGGTSSDSQSPVAIDTSNVTGERTFVHLASGVYHTCTLTSEGVTYCWGDDQYGALGDGGASSHSQLPVAVDTSGISGERTFVQMTGGWSSTCGLGADGVGYCWGRDRRGQLGDGGSSIDSQSPVAVDTSSISGEKTFVQLMSGYEHVCGLTASGAVYCWGADDYGQLGSGGGKVDSQSPVAVDTSPVIGGKIFLQIGGGIGFHTCGLTSQRVAYCWGYNGEGELGNGTPGNDEQNTPVPTDVSGVAIGETVVAVTAGVEYACGLTAKGIGHCWGSDQWGQLGNGIGLGSSPSPTPVDTSAFADGNNLAVISAGDGHSCGLTADGLAYCWGFDDDGQLGNGGTAGGSQSPTAVSTAPIAGTRSIRQLATGYNHSCAVTAQGKLYCWGRNGSGQLGDGGQPNSSQLPAAVDTAAVPDASAFLQVVAGYGHSCGLTAQGAAYCWGDDSSSQLGNGLGAGDSPVPLPVDTSSMTGEKTFARLSAGDSHNCGLTARGVAYCWGHDGNGGLGDGGPAADSEMPVAVDTSPITGEKTFIALAAGGFHTCGLTSQGIAYCWGWGRDGQLGDGAALPRADALGPVAVDLSSLTGEKTFLRLTAGGQFTCGWTSEGAAYCWGAGWAGQLGNGETSTQSSLPLAVDTTPF